MAPIGSPKLESWIFYLFNALVRAWIGRFVSDKSTAFYRYLEWAGGPKALRYGRTYFGAMMRCRLRDHIMAHVFFFNVWEPDISHVIETVLEPGDTFIDLGANVGYDTLLASSKVGSGGRVVAIEAASHIFAQLQVNVDLNQTANVRAVHVAVSNAPGELVLYGGDAGNQGRTSSLAREGLTPLETVPMLPLDAVLTAEERAGVRMIKMDIEGGELSVLQRLVATLDLYPYDLHILVELSPDETTRPALARVFDDLLAQGFEAYTLENDYEVEWYFAWRRPGAPQRIHQVPTYHTDVHFRRPARTGPRAS
jgi:FkbM family methyltransferase